MSKSISKIVMINDYLKYAVADVRKSTALCPIIFDNGDVLGQWLKYKFIFKHNNIYSPYFSVVCEKGFKEAEKGLPISTVPKFVLEVVLDGELFADVMEGIAYWADNLVREIILIDPVNEVIAQYVLNNQTLKYDSNVLMRVSDYLKFVVISELIGEKCGIFANEFFGGLGIGLEG